MMPSDQQEASRSRSVALMDPVPDSSLARRVSHPSLVRFTRLQAKPVAEEEVVELAQWKAQAGQQAAVVLTLGLVLELDAPLPLAPSQPIAWPPQFSRTYLQP